MTEQMTQPVTKKVNVRRLLLSSGAELAGTFLICLGIYLVSALGAALYGSNLILVMLTTAFAYGVVTLIFDRVSDAQFNPAITVAAMLTGRTGILQGLCSIVAQVIGAIASAAVLRFVIPTSKEATASIWFTGAVNGFGAGSMSNAQLSQVHITFGLAFAMVVEVVAGIIIVATFMRTTSTGNTSSPMRAAAMAAAYAVGVAITYPVTGSSLNPARSTGIAIFAKGAKLTQDPLQQLWAFWVGPILAAALVAIVIIFTQIGSDSADKKVENSMQNADLVDSAFGDVENNASMVPGADNAAQAEQTEIPVAVEIAEETAFESVDDLSANQDDHDTKR